MPKQEKIDKVAEIRARLEEAEAAYFADYRGLSVPDIGEVRGALREAEAQFSVLKNSLTKLAVTEIGMEDLVSILEGPTAVAFVKGDIVSGAKALVDAAKKFDVLEVKGGMAEGRVLTADEIKELAALDTREEMLAKIAGMLQIHMRKAASLFQALQVKFLMTLKAYEEELAKSAPAEEEAPAEDAAAEDAPAEETPAEEPEAPAEQASADEAPAEEAADGDETNDDEQDEQQEEGA